MKYGNRYTEYGIGMNVKKYEKSVVSGNENHRFFVFFCIF